MWNYGRDLRRARSTRVTTTGRSSAASGLQHSRQPRPHYLLPQRRRNLAPGLGPTHPRRRRRGAARTGCLWPKACAGVRWLRSLVRLRRRALPRTRCATGHWNGSLARARMARRPAAVTSSRTLRGSCGTLHSRSRSRRPRTACSRRTSSGAPPTSRVSRRKAVTSLTQTPISHFTFDCTRCSSSASRVRSAGRTERSMRTRPFAICRRARTKRYGSIASHS